MKDESTIAFDDQNIAKFLPKTKKCINGDVFTITTPEESSKGCSLSMFISQENFTMSTFVSLSNTDRKENDKNKHCIY
jgi:hypothetical protein